MPLTLGLCLLLCASGQTPAPPAAGPDGTWEVTAAIDNGEVIPVALLKERMVRDGRLTVAGQEITFVRPGTAEKRTLLIITNPAANPPAVDIGGTDKVGGKGIYQLAGDSLMICLSGPGVETRPAEFASHAGTHALLMTLRRVPPGGAAPAAPAAPVVRGVNPPAAADVRKMLLGTWGSQDNTQIDYYTFNPDGTFSIARQWKSALKKLFEPENRWSGTWALENHTVVMRVTASTDNTLVGQVYSWRLNSISPTDLIFLTQEGKVLREWRVR